MQMQVIGSGFGRTGTTSMKAALELLGFGPCYRMQEVFKRPSHAQAWGRWRPGTTPDLDHRFGGFRSAVDFPAALVYEELLDRFPHAKVLHTVRDADRWYDSTAETIYRAREVLRSGPLRFVLQIRDLYEMLDLVIWDGMFDGRFDDRSHAIDVYERWTRHVVDTVPADRLLVFDVAEGWGPCVPSSTCLSRPDRSRGSTTRSCSSAGSKRSASGHGLRRQRWVSGSPLRGPDGVAPLDAVPDGRGGSSRW